ncbi:hypothetical protein [Pedobacter sp.]
MSFYFVNVINYNNHADENVKNFNEKAAVFKIEFKMEKDKYN